MTCNFIYEYALALIGEARHSASTADYAARVPALISLVFLRLRTLSDRFLGTSTDAESLIIASLDEPYPLAPELIEAVCLNVASLLILDELPEVSDRLEAKAARSADAAAMTLNTVSNL